MQMDKSKSESVGNIMRKSWCNDPLCSQPLVTLSLAIVREGQWHISFGTPQPNQYASLELSALMRVAMKRQFDYSA